MADKTYVRISVERQMLILGQIGNMRQKIDRMKSNLEDGGDVRHLPALADIAIELGFFEEYFPSIPDSFPF